MFLVDVKFYESSRQLCNEEIKDLFGLNEWEHWIENWKKNLIN